MIVSIYTLTDPNTGRVRYVGQTNQLVDDRFYLAPDADETDIYNQLRQNMKLSSDEARLMLPA